MIQALGPVQVALVDAVDADEARTAVGGWRLAHADRGGLGGAGLGQHHALRAVGRAVAQVVQVAHRDRAQAFEARVAEDIALASQDAGRGRARHRVHGPIDIGQQRHVGGRVAPRKGVLRRAVALDQGLTRQPTRHQPLDLRAAVAAQALQVRQHHPSVGALEATVLKPPQHQGDPGVAPLVVLGPAELQGLRAAHHLSHLLQGAHLRFVHVDHHPFDDRLASQARSP